MLFSQDWVRIKKSCQGWKASQRKKYGFTFSFTTEQEPSFSHGFGIHRGLAFPHLLKTIILKQGG